MTDEERAEAERKDRQRVYERTRDGIDASARQMSGDYDRALLTLSSAFLGGSLALTSQVVTLNGAAAKWMLHVAWAFFALTILLTLASFVHALIYTDRLRDAAQRYYILKDEKAYQVSVDATRVAKTYLIVCGVCFGLGILLQGGFISINVYREANMQNKEGPKVVQKSIPQGAFQRPTEAPAQPATGGGQQTPQGSGQGNGGSGSGNSENGSK